MKIYRVGLRDKSEEHKGYFYFSRLKDANACKSELEAKDFSVEIEPPEKHPVTAKGMLRALNLYGGHPDNG